MKKLFYIFLGLVTAITTAASATETLPFEPEMVQLEGGTFQMGCVSGKYCRSDEKPVHNVIIKAFEIGKYEVTFDQRDECVKQKGCKFSPKKRWGGGKQPVVSISWADAQEYVAWLSQKTGKVYRLPSEAEWEYVARANTKTPFSAGECLHTDQANHKGGFVLKGCPKAGKINNQAVEVGSYSANGFGLFDMDGNLSEFVQDCYHTSYVGAPTDGSAWETDCYKKRGVVQRVYRGGAWVFTKEYSRSARRNKAAEARRPFVLHGVGFRIARTL